VQPHPSGLMSGRVMTASPIVFRHYSAIASSRTGVSEQWPAASQGITTTLQPRLTPRAQVELETVKDVLSSLQLTEAPDRRDSPLMDKEGKLHTSALYALLRSTPDSQTDGQRVAWQNHAPPRVKFFAWLLTRKRIQCRSNLQRRKVLEDATCEVCGRGDENANHIIFNCPFAASFWSGIGFVIPADADVSCLDKLSRPAQVPPEHFSTLILLCCCQLWKRRNGVVFRQEAATRREILRLAKEDARLWQARLPRKDACVAETWGEIFSLAL
jgi:hypothetical protein